MKNLKKVLALVLTVAMVLSFTIAAGAFSDTTTYAKNTEAVDVMSMLKVINGYSDGTFKGDKNVTRAEMAKMICYIISSGDDVGSIYAGANTFTDCTSHWAKGYIAYAAKTGLVAGIGNGKFDPNGNVTGTQAAKMLLCALGYSATNEKYVGANWDVNVLAKADEIGLLDSLTATDMSKALTRADAAQMMFNALKGTMVKYSTGGTTVTTKDGTVVTTGASTADEVANKSFDYRETTTSEATKTAGTQQLCEKYFKDLKLASTPDAFQRPADKWTYKNDSVTAANTPDVVYTGEVKGKQVYADLGKTTIDNIQKNKYTVVAYRNGAADSYVTNAYFGSSYVYSSSTKTLNENGLTAEIYVDDSNKTVTVILIDTILAQVTNVNDKDKDNIILTLDPQYGSITLNTVSEDDLSADFSKIAEDDYVLITGVKNGTKYDVKSIATPKTVEGVMSANNDSAITFAGTKYNLSTDFADVDSKLLGGSSDFDSTFTLYLDANGYAVGSIIKDEVTNAKDYLYVSDRDYDKYGAISGNAYAKVAAHFTDGTSKVVNLYVKDATKSTASLTISGKSYTITGSSVLDINTALADGWYSYTTTSDGLYKLSKVSSTKGSSTAFAVDGTTASFSSDSAKVNYTSSNYVTATSTTTLSLLDSGKSYTGYKNFIDSTKITKLTTSSILYVMTSKTSSTVKAIYVYGDDSISESTTVAYYAGKDHHDADGDWYKFYVDGKEVLYTVATANQAKLATGKVFSLKLSDTEADPTLLNGTKTSDKKYTYTVETATIKSVNTDYFTVDNSGTESDPYYTANDDESVKFAAYDVTDGVASKTLKKNDSVTLVYMTNSTGDMYAVTAYVTE